MDLKLQDGITLNWGTPILALRPTDHDVVTAELKRIILERRSTDPGLKKSNFGGWHSNDDLLSWPSPAVQSLQTWIIDGLKLGDSANRQRFILQWQGCVEVLGKRERTWAL